VFLLDLEGENGNLPTELVNEAKRFFVRILFLSPTLLVVEYDGFVLILNISSNFSDVDQSV